MKYEIKKGEEWAERDEVPVESPLPVLRALAEKHGIEPPRDSMQIDVFVLASLRVILAELGIMPVRS